MGLRLKKKQKKNKKLANSFPEISKSFKWSDAKKKKTDIMSYII